jgi:hypothetical protein
MPGALPRSISGTPRLLNAWIGRARRDMSVASVASPNSMKWIDSLSSSVVRSGYLSGDEVFERGESGFGQRELDDAPFAGQAFGMEQFLQILSADFGARLFGEHSIQFEKLDAVVLDRYLQPR